MKVLLVEDSPTQAILTISELSAIEGMDVEHVETLAGTFKALKEGEFQLVLLDLTLPDSEGFDTVTRVCDYAPDLPVIVLTSRDDQEVVWGALKAGAQDFLVKGHVNTDLFARTFRNAIYRKQVAEELKHARDEAVRASRALEGQIKKIGCLYALSEALHQEGSLAERMVRAAALVPEAWQFSDITFARIRHPEGEALSPNFRESAAGLSHDIVVDGDVVGGVDVFVVDAAGGLGGDPFSSEEHRLVVEIAGRLGEAVERTLFQQELQRLATTDPLTGANNRRSFMAMADREWGRVQRYKRPASLMMLDVDHFKKVNDTYGHAAGDEVLKSLVTVCKETLRSHDFLGRLGGEEFAVMLPEDDLDGALIVAERLRRALAAMEVPLEDGGALRITTSIGVAECLSTLENLEACLNLADQALYEAKEGGRDRVVAAG